MIDFHNHVLPNVDDGPNNIKESLEMIHHAAKQGITDIVQTVHFQHPKMDGKNTDYQYLKRKINFLQNKINIEKLNVKMHLSAEVFYLPNLIGISKNPLVTIGNGKYMLVEFRGNIFPLNFENEFYKLQLNGITPIVAHPERYRFIQNDISILETWMDRGYILQMDAGSIIGNFGESIKKISKKIIDNNFIHLIGSDAHNNKKRNFCLKEAYEYLEKIKSSNYTDLLKKNVQNLLNGNRILNIEYDLEKNNTTTMTDKIFKLLRKL